MIKNSIRTVDRAIRLPYWQRITVWPLQLTAATAFLIAGCAKLVNAEDMVTLFEDINWGQAVLINNIGWNQLFRYLIGSIQIVSAVLLLFPDRAFWGGLLLSTTMVGAAFAHLFVIGDSPTPAIVLFCMAATVTWLRQP